MSSYLPATIARGIFERAKKYLSGNADFPEVTRIPDDWLKVQDQRQRALMVLKVFMPESDAENISRAWLKRLTKGCKATGANLDETLNKMIQAELEYFYKVQEFARDLSMKSLRKFHPDDLPDRHISPYIVMDAHEMALNSLVPAMTRNPGDELLVCREQHSIRDFVTMEPLTIPMLTLPTLEEKLKDAPPAPQIEEPIKG